MHSQQNIHVLRQLVADREAQLHSAGVSVGSGLPRRHVRRWAGTQLVRLGAWVASEPGLRPATAR